LGKIYGKEILTQTVAETITGVTSSIVLDSAFTYKKHTLTQNVMFELTSSVTTGYMNSVTVKINQGGSPYTVTWPAGILWSDGVEHQMSTGSGEVDFVNIYTDDGGSTYYGIITGQAFS
jgi:hypothetical protein